MKEKEKIRTHLTDEEVVINLIECAGYLAERDDNMDTLTVEVLGRVITFHIDLSNVKDAQEE